VPANFSPGSRLSVVPDAGAWKPASNDGLPVVISITDCALAQIAAALKCSLHAAGVAIALEADDGIVCRAAAGHAAPDIGTRVARGEGITWACVCSGAEICCPDTKDDPRVNAEVCRQFGIRSLLLVPVQRKERVVGLVEAMFSTPRGFEAGAVESLKTAAQQVVSRVYADPAAENVATAVRLARADGPAAGAVVATTSSATHQPATRTLNDDSPNVAVENALLPSFAAAAEALRPPYAIILTVAIVCGALLGAMVALKRHAARSVVLAPHTTMSERAEPPAEPREYTTGERAEPPAEPREGNQTGGDEPQLAAISPMKVAETASSFDLQRSAEQGMVDAQYEFGQALETGRGMAANPVEACTWYLVAGMAGNAQAELAYRRLTPKLTQGQIGRIRFRIGELYTEGRGVPRSLVSAYRWFVLADDAGDRDAPAAMALLSTKMNPQEITEATTLAEAWLNRHRAANVRRMAAR